MENQLGRVIQPLPDKPAGSAEWLCSATSSQDTLWNRKHFSNESCGVFLSPQGEEGPEWGHYQGNGIGFPLARSAS